MRAGWVVLDKDRRVRGQVYHLQPIPVHLQLELIDNGFENSLMVAGVPEPDTAVPDVEALPLKSSANTDLQLEALHKEIRLDFHLNGRGRAIQTASGRNAAFPDKLEGDYLEARDRSSRLLGHLRAIEKALKTLAAP